MDLDEPIEPLQERAASSPEPTTARQKPFDEDDQSSSRKRQRLTSDEAENVSTAVNAQPEFAMSSPTPKDEAIIPSTPTRIAKATTPNSNKVTLNLRNTREVPEPSTSSSPPITPSKAPAVTNNIIMKEEKSDEPEVDANNIHPTIETPSSSSSLSSEPEVMLVESEQEEYFSLANPPVAIIDEDMLLEEDMRDPTIDFPFLEDGEILAEAAQRLAAFYEHAHMHDARNLTKFRIWIDRYIKWARQNPDEAYTSYCDTREFWGTIHDVIVGLTYRKPHFGQWLKILDSPGRRALSLLFQSLASLTGHFVNMDLRTLKLGIETPDMQPHLASRPFLDAIHTLLFVQRDGLFDHVGINLTNHYSWDWDNEMSDMHAALEAQGARMQTFVQLAKAYMDISKRFPKCVENLQEVCRYMAFALRFSLPDRGPVTQEYVNNAILAYNSFEMMEKHLGTFIEKNGTFLNAESVTGQIIAMTDMLNYIVWYRNSPAETRVAQTQQSDPELPLRYSKIATSATWKLSMLIKLVNSSQMQLRVAGITGVTVELLRLHNTRDNPNSVAVEEHPLLRHVANFLVEKQLVEYIVGVGSHPEIILQSRDLHGFLAVTHTWSNYHTDKMFSTVKSSLDPRVVDSVLKITGELVPMVSPGDRLYFCTKLQGIPVESFTVGMRHFCEILFRLTGEDAKGKSADIEAPPYELCVRLIRESTVPRADTPMAFNEVQQWASNQFQKLTSRDYYSGPDTSVRRDIYKGCIDDLRGGETADGSLIALSILVEANPTDLRELIAMPDFAQLLIDNFSWRKTGNSITKHLRLFRQIILWDFIKDPTNLGLQIWNKIIGADEADIDGDDRQDGWKMLSNVMRQVKSDNAFMKACIQQYLPNLQPHLFSKASFSFARDAIGYFSKDDPESRDDGALIDQNGIEQLWRMVMASNGKANFQDYAIQNLISFYLESSTVNQMPDDKVLETHLIFVDRCLRQLTSAAGKLKSFSEGTASGDDEPMIIVPMDKEVHEQESLFCRSLLLLQGFLRAYESNPQFAPTKTPPKLINPLEPNKGELMTFKYQICDGRTPASELREMTIGGLNTAASLYGTLQELAGFKGIRVFHMGKEIVTSDTDLSKSLDDLNLGPTAPMIVSRVPESESWNERSRVQLEVMKSFDSLFELLSMDGTQAKEIYDFLISFPTYTKLQDALCSHTNSCQELFPAQYPYKSLYAMRGMNMLMKDQSLSDRPDMRIKTRCFDLAIDTLTLHEYLDAQTDEIKLTFFIELLDVFSHCFKDVSLRECFASRTDSEVLLNKLMHLFFDARKSSSTFLFFDAQKKNTSRLSTKLMNKVFGIMLNMSTSSSSFWMKFKVHPETAKVVQTVLLDRVEVNQREGPGHPSSLIRHLCSSEISSSHMDQIELLQFFWPLLSGLVPRATLRPERCQPLLSLVQAVLRAAIETSRDKCVSIDGLDLVALSNEFGRLLVSHKVVQYVGRPAIIDPIAYGLACLLKDCVSLVELSSVEPLRPLAFSLFKTHLFPDLALAKGSVSHLPLLDSATRKLIVEVIQTLVNGDVQSSMNLMKMVTDLVPDPDENGEYRYDLSPIYDRSREIRSATGYVGLKNLSNTCYLNSLMTQLFMNLSFREFMINARVADGGVQNLLRQTQILFCEMQNSFKRCADPAELAQSIKTYEELPVDVTVQMDVDEFYNLLFDRWEGQILAADAKTTFRSFYGGQLVQQVKSKECAHISERLEPFSAIQCDIKGKASLEESLQAYVDGEIMEGDNKYKCSTCDQHVDAVKRACLKDVPDNLIFHLKRFDYNLREGRRNKLNDYFSFPNDIDMRPYKVDYLTNGPEGSEEDVFELVGVLVHSGTAESGHYYSYIRERPSTDSKSWVEFNDDTVTSFDPSNIEACCFGGSNYQANEYQFDKGYSAYMLFYQRRSFLMAQKQKLSPSLGLEPMKLPIHPDAAHDIDLKNSVMMRMYALYDPSHAQFVKDLLTRNCAHEAGGSPKHLMEDQALKMTMNHMDQVFGRTKDTPEFRDFFEMLKDVFEGCALCSESFILWISASNASLKYLLIKSPDIEVRAGIADLIIVALTTLKKDAPKVYGVYKTLRRPIAQGYSHEDALHKLNLEHGAFGAITEAVSQLWESVLSSIRAWPEYFDLIGRMNDGVHEAALLMDNDLMWKTTEIVMTTYLASKEQRQEIMRLMNLLSRRSPSKPPAYDVVVSVLDKFLRAFGPMFAKGNRADRTWRSEQQFQDRSLPLAMWHEEFTLFSLHWTAKDDHILIGDLLRLNTTDSAVQSILQQLLTKWEERRNPIAANILKAITLNLSKSCLSSRPIEQYLSAAETYCRYVDDSSLFYEMREYITECVQNYELSDGALYLQFFKNLYDLPDNRVGLSKEEHQSECTKFVASWGPGLLFNYDLSVRTDTYEYISETVLKFCSSDTIDDDEEKICHETARTLGNKCLEYLDDHVVRKNAQVLRAQLNIILKVCAKCTDSFEEDSIARLRYIDSLNSVSDGALRNAVANMDDEGSVGSDDWEQSDGELSSSSVLMEDRGEDALSLLDQ